MFGWIKSNIGIKNVIVLLSVVLFFVGIFKGPDLYKMIKKTQFDGYARAQVLNIETKTTSVHSFSGINNTILGYDMTYEFDVVGDTYSHTQFLEPDVNVQSLISQFENGKPCIIEIAYSVEDPEENIITSVIIKNNNGKK